MAIRAKLVIIFFAFIIVPMFLLWARWQDTAIGSIKSVLRQSLGERAREINDQINRSLQNHQAQLLELTRQPAMQSYARGAMQSTQVLPDKTLRQDLSAFLLAHQPAYAALIGVNRQGAPLFKIEPGPGPNGVVYPFFSERDFSSEEI